LLSGLLAFSHIARYAPSRCKSIYPIKKQKSTKAIYRSNLSRFRLNDFAKLYNNFCIGKNIGKKIKNDMWS
jgi:hypothetical protein